jgi:hypothetical protein
MTVCLLGSCAPPRASEGGFDSPNPASKLYAIHRAGEHHDITALPRLVEQLDNDDLLVRMMAAQALSRITGTRLGYNPYSPVEEQREAIGRWTDHIRSERWDKHEPWKNDDPQ